MAIARYTTVGSAESLADDNGASSITNIAAEEEMTMTTSSGSSCLDDESSLSDSESLVSDKEPPSESLGPGHFEDIGMSTNNEDHGDHIPQGHE